MSNIAYAASIAQQGLRDLGKGIGDFADKKSDAAMAEEFRKNNPGAQGETLSEGLRLGKIEVAQAEQLTAQDASLNPMTVIGSMVKKLHDPQTTPEQASTLKQQIFGLTEVLQMQSALKKASSGGGGGGSSGGKKSKGVEQASNAPTWSENPDGVISHIVGQAGIGNALKSSIGIHYKQEIKNLEKEGYTNEEIGAIVAPEFQKSLAAAIAQNGALKGETPVDKAMLDKNGPIDKANQKFYPKLSGRKGKKTEQAKDEQVKTEQETTVNDYANTVLSVD